MLRPFNHFWSPLRTTPAVSRAAPLDHRTAMTCLRLFLEALTLGASSTLACGAKTLAGSSGSRMFFMDGLDLVSLTSASWWCMARIADEVSADSCTTVSWSEPCSGVKRLGFSGDSAHLISTSSLALVTPA